MAGAAEATPVQARCKLGATPLVHRVCSGFAPGLHRGWLRCSRRSVAHRATSFDLRKTMQPLALLFSAALVPKDKSLVGKEATCVPAAKPPFRPGNVQRPASRTRTRDGTLGGLTHYLPKACPDFPLKAAARMELTTPVTNSGLLIPWNLAGPNWLRAPVLTSVLTWATPFS